MVHAIGAVDLNQLVIVLALIQEVPRFPFEAQDGGIRGNMVVFDEDLNVKVGLQDVDQFVVPSHEGPDSPGHRLFKRHFEGIESSPRDPLTSHWSGTSFFFFRWDICTAMTFILPSEAFRPEICLISCPK